MFKKLSLQTKIVSLLILTFLLALGLVVLLFLYNKKLMALDFVKHEIVEIDNHLQKSILAQNEFLLSESRTKLFFLHEKSRQIEICNTHNAKINAILGNLRTNELIKDFELTKEVDKIAEEIGEFSLKCKQLEAKTRLKGFVDFGLEGEFRTYIHEIENDFGDLVPLNLVLEIRRREKDYLLRSNEQYKTMLENLVDSSITLLSHNSNIRKLKAAKLFEGYIHAFNEYVALDVEIGRDVNNGLRKEIYGITSSMLKNTNALSSEFCQKEEVYKADLRFYTLLIIMVYLSLILFLIGFAANAITLPLKRLTINLKDFVSENFTQKTIFPPFNRSDEIGELQKSAYIMQTEITEHFTKFREDSQLRERELSARKEKLEIQKFLLQQSRNDLFEKSNLLQDSINCAVRIQRAILPSGNQISAIFDQSMIYHSPLKTISGDFYWVHDSDRFQFFALADCTGHGVPGALMSILGLNFIDFAVKEKYLTKPNEILNYLNQKIAETLHQNGSNSEVKDGMDIGIFRLDKITNEIDFSGAQMNLCILSNGQLKKIKGDRQAIGWIYDEGLKSFTNHVYSLEREDKLLLFSDGLIDQFGGPQGKKYKFRNLEEVLLKVSEKSIYEVFDMILESFQMWKSNYEQTDDVSFALFEPYIEPLLKVNQHASLFQSNRLPAML